MMGKDLLDLGNMLLAVALLFGLLIVAFEWAERRREGRRERLRLDAIEEEYQAWFGAWRA
jgi:hypothetical protein